MRGKLVATLILTLALGLGLWIIAQAKGPSAEKTARDVAQLLQNRSWSELYDLSSERERTDLGISKDQFRILMDKIASDFHPSSVQVSQASPLFKGSRIFLLKVINPVQDYDGTNKGDGTFSITARLNPSGSWTSDIWDLPMLINRFGPSNRTLRLQRLKEAMEAAQIERVKDWLTGRYLTTETLGRDIQRNDGKMSWK